MRRPRSQDGLCRCFGDERAKGPMPMDAGGGVGARMCANVEVHAPSFASLMRGRLTRVRRREGPPRRGHSRPRPPLAWEVPCSCRFCLAIRRFDFCRAPWESCSLSFPDYSYLLSLVLRLQYCPTFGYQGGEIPPLPLFNRPRHI
jgi:hypothetical protein